MSMMEWNDNLVLGHSRIDADHKRLVGLINQLSDAMAGGKGKNVCGHVLDELIAYTRTHFAMEEQLMATHRYARALDHKTEHAKLVEEVLDFKSKYDAGTVTLSVSLLRFLVEWLTHHILESDKDLAQAIPPG
ncbi:MAG: hemerythrin family protein [Betaproteobacteria bacterium]|nr:hemerythrin family protein [Betaproteobacteria bacterium]